MQLCASACWSAFVAFHPALPFAADHLLAAYLGEGVSPLCGRAAEGHRSPRQLLDRQSVRI